MSRQFIRSRFLTVASALVWGLVACQTTPPPTENPSPAPVSQAAGQPVPGSRELAVVPAESLLQIFVYRGGKMARLGHNHVIAVHQLAGKVFLAPDLADTRFDISFR